jgi:hypothetical protein
MPPPLSLKILARFISFIADEYSEKDFNTFVTNAEEASKVMELLQTVSLYGI